MTGPRILYWGVQSSDNKGHYLFVPGFRKAASPGQDAILYDEKDRHLDGGWLKAQGVRDIPGLAAYRQLNGYSVVTWWDRSGDSRGASNSAFLVEGDYTIEQVMVLGNVSFPTIIPRQQAQIVLPDGTLLYPKEGYQ